MNKTAQMKLKTRQAKIRDAIILASMESVTYDANYGLAESCVISIAGQRYKNVVKTWE